MSGKNRRCLTLLASLATMPLLSIAAASEKPAPPYFNPYWADSAWALTHTRADFTPLPGPTGPGHRLRADEIQWKPFGPLNGWMPTYSGPYPNGKRVIWAGGYDRVAKLDADTLEVLTTYAIGGNTYFGEEEVRHMVATMHKLDDRGLADYALKLWAEPIRSTASSVTA